MIAPVGNRKNAARNSNQWAGRPPSQRIHRKNWTPPDLREGRSDSDKILCYSSQDYLIGESSQDMLQRIAHRLNNGLSPPQTLPEQDTTELGSEMAELSRQRSAVAELQNDSFAVELDAGPATYLTLQVNRSHGETVSSRHRENRTTGHLSGPFHEPQDLPEDTEHAPPSAAHQVSTGNRKWEGVSVELDPSPFWSSRRTTALGLALQVKYSAVFFIHV